MVVMGSKPPAFTSPALAMTMAGAPLFVRRAPSNAPTSSRPAASRLNVVREERPIPNIARHFTALA